MGREGRRLRQRRTANAFLASTGEGAGRSAFRSLADRGVLQALHHRRGLASGNARLRTRITGARRCSTCCSATAMSTASRSRECRPEYENKESKDFGFYLQKGLFEEYAAFGRGHGHDLAPYDTLSRGARPALAGRQRQGNAWRYREGYDPYVKPGEGVDFYGQPDGKATSLRCPTSRRRSRPTRNSISGW